MALTKNRLDNILQRLLTFMATAKSVDFPREGLDKADIEQRKAIRQRLDILKSSLLSALTNLEAAPTETDITQEELIERIEHGNAAVLRVKQAIETIQFVLTIPAGVNLTATQKTTLETRLLQFRDAALTELNLM